MSGLDRFSEHGQGAKECAFCGEPAVPDAAVEIRLYLGPGDKLGELDLAVCVRHLARMRPAYEQELVECRVTRWERGRRNLGSLTPGARPWAGSAPVTPARGPTCSR